MKGVKFGTKHSFDDLNLILNNKDIPLPEPKTYILDVPGADGQLDLSTALTDGDIKYKNRILTFNFTINEPFDKWEFVKSKVAAYLHGKIMEVILDVDKDYFFIGRCTISTAKTRNPVATLTVTVDAEPYKYSVHTSTERVIWDTFNFETGIWYDMAGLTVSGEKTVVVPSQEMRVVPTIIVSNDMSLVYKTTQYALYTGDNIIPAVQLSSNEEDNTLKFIGNGTVTIDFRGGIL